MTPYPPSVDELYVVSDIHMGGRKDGEEDFQIFNRGPRLGAFIRHVAEQRPDGEVAIVLNGDVIDSLAEEEVASYVALDAHTAIQMMDHLYADPSFKPVWDALASFVRTPRRHLVFVVGNHDIELALPVVEDSIRRHLAGDSSDAWSRIHFASHGGGFGCRVGHARVFCCHGNEIDRWNWVDYSALGQLANAINAGRSVPPSRWKPNAGTKLVIDVMNHVKRRYPFVDLLKPEIAAVASVLMTLDRDLVKKVDLSSVLPIWRGWRRGGKVTDEILGAYAADIFSGAPEDATPDAVADSLLGTSLREAVRRRGAGPGMSEDELLLDAARALRAQAGETASEDEPETLGAWDMVAGWVGLVPKEEGLRRALKDWLEDDKGFVVHDPDDDLYKSMEERIGDSVDFVVTGHTHKPRAMSYESGVHYFNCGTWIRRLHLTQQVLNDENAFKEKLWRVLRAGRMSALDTARIPGPDGREVPLLFDRTNAVRIVTDGQQVVGDLLRVTDGGSGGVNLEPEKGTTPFHAR